MILLKEKRENESQFEFHDPFVRSYHIRNESSIQSVQVQLEYRDVQQNDCDLLVQPASKVMLAVALYNPQNKEQCLSSKMSIWQYVQNLLKPTREQKRGLFQQFLKMFKQAPAPTELDIQDLKGRLQLQAQYGVAEQFNLIFQKTKNPGIHLQNSTLLKSQEEREETKEDLNLGELRPLIIVDDSVQVQEQHYQSIYLISLLISDIIYEILATANLSTVDTNSVHISTFGVQMLSELIRPNTEQKRMFLCRLLAFSQLEGVFRFIELNDSYKISKISLIYGNELSMNDLELHREINTEMKKILNHLYSQEQSVAKFGLGRIDYFPGLGPLNYNNQTITNRFFPLIPFEHEFPSYFPSIHSFIAFVSDYSQFDYYTSILKDYSDTLEDARTTQLTRQEENLQTLGLVDGKADTLPSNFMQPPESNFQLKKVISSQQKNQQIHLSALISVLQALHVAEYFCKSKTKISYLHCILTEITAKSPQYMVIVSQLYKEHILAKINEFLSSVELQS